MVEFAPELATEGFYSIESLVGVHVLVVDGAPECRDLFSAILRYCGALVSTAASAAEAMEIMRLVKCDVLVAGIALPGEDGLDLIRKVRALKPEDGGVLRAIAVAAGAGIPENREDAIAAGFDLYLTRPVDSWELCRAVASLALGSC
jgi:CheY-like chemotaxis protein